MGDEFDGGVSSYDPSWDRYQEAELKFVWWPKRCYESNKRIWLTLAYRFRRYVYGPAGEPPVIYDRWLTCEEAMIKILKG